MGNMKYKSIDEYLWKTRTKQEDFAADLGVNSSYISLLKNGKRTPSLRMALKISKKTGIDIERLL
jgi:transcriptional regulator with XRE-family HTH domain